jgi:hypothetical protein
VYASNAKIGDLSAEPIALFFGDGRLYEVDVYFQAKTPEIQRATFNVLFEALCKKYGDVKRETVTDYWISAWKVAADTPMEVRIFLSISPMKPQVELSYSYSSRYKSQEAKEKAKLHRDL